MPPATYLETLTDLASCILEYLGQHFPASLVTERLVGEIVLFNKHFSERPSGRTGSFISKLNSFVERSVNLDNV